MSSIEKIKYLLDELNHLMADEFMFPDWEKNGAGYYEAVLNVNGALKSCHVEYRSAQDCGFAVYRRTDYSNMDMEAFFAMCYLELFRGLLFSKDTLKENGECVLRDASTDLPIINLSFNTLCKEGNARLLKSRVLTRQKQ